MNPTIKRIDRAFLDRGFANSKCVKSLNKNRIKFVMPVPRNNRIKQWMDEQENIEISHPIIQPEENTDIPPQTTQSKKKIKNYKRLTRTYEVVTHFPKIPQFRTYQEQLIKIYYKNLKKGKDNTERLKRLSENQIRSTATDFFNRAWKIWNSKTQKKKL